MTNEQVHDYAPDEQDPVAAIERPELTADELGNVIAFPVRPEARPAYTSKGEETESDPEGEIDRTHIDYELSKQRVSSAIKQLGEDKDREALRQASFMRSRNADDIADRKSERAFASVEGLKRPAGTTKKIGSDALRIIE